MEHIFHVIINRTFGIWVLGHLFFKELCGLRSKHFKIILSLYSRKILNVVMASIRHD
jgi:hypothetical protein